jgi:hypothetical protein
MLPGGLDWHADRVVLSLGLLHFWRLSVEPQGEQTIRVAGTKAVVFSADTLVAHVPLGGRVDRLSLQADGLTAGMLKSRQRQDVRIDHLALRVEAARKGSARVSAQAVIDAQGVALPDNGRWPLGALVRRASATIDLASPALSGAAPLDQARAWRDWGGTVVVRSLKLGWGPLDLRAQAHLALDDKLQPAGGGTATVTGWAQTVDALAAGGTISGGMAQTVKMVLGLMSHAPEDANGTPQGGDAAETPPGDDGAGTPTGGDISALSLPFTLKDNTLSVGKIPLIRLHDVNWGSV